LDRITEVSDPRDIDTQYTYNGFGDLTREISPDRGTTSYTYDSAGNLKTLTDARGVKHTYIWDALNRPTKRAHTTVSGVTGIASLLWNYDSGTNGIGRLTSFSDQSGSTGFSYDLHGRLLTKTQTANLNAINFTQTLSYQYDSFGRINQMTYPSGTQITTTYGADGRPTELRINGNLLLSNIVYQPFGEPKSWIWGNGQAYTRSFDQDGRLATHPMGGDTRIITYDAASRITQTTDTNAVYNRSFDYDALDRLTNQTDNTSSKLWGFDANGNRTNAQFGSTNYAYTISGTNNHLQAVAGPAARIYTYDAAGNPLSDGITTFAWNAAGKLNNIIINNIAYNYKYNALDQRVTKSGPLTPKYFFFYGMDGQLIGEYKDNTATANPTDDWLIRQETVWLDDIPVAVIKKPTPTSPIQISYIHTDHLNTPRVIINQNNTPVWRWDNVHAFGANLPDEDPDGNAQLFEYNPRFPGQYFDKETGLHYNYFRYYEPETGRYLTPDPIGLAGGLNLYGYTLQNSMSFTDSDGLLPDAIVDLGLIAADIASYAYNKVRGCDTSEDIASLKANTLGLLIPGATGLGLGVRAIGKITKGETTVIGRIKDLQNLRKGERSLLDRLPDQGSSKLNWKRNSSVLRQEMTKKQPIRDASPNDIKGQFLNAERNLLERRGWSLDPNTNYWMPPK
jgi:RHS repeat-associated protein